MSIHALAESVPEDVVDMGNTQFFTKAVYGNASSMLIATRPAGYHSRPHRHDCEQLNWLMSGEAWVFIEDQAYLVKAGDFLRIPSGVIHWSWNRSDKPCTVVEVHTPGLHDDTIIKSFAVGLFDADETPDFTGSPMNIFLDENSSFDSSIAESKVTG